MRRLSNSLLSQMSRLLLYSNVLFIWLLVFFEQPSALQSLIFLSRQHFSLLHCVVLGGYIG